MRLLDIKKGLLLGLMCLSIGTISRAQITTDQLTGKELSDLNNVISTAVPFLTITPDSRAGAMGDVGAATSADINSIYWNAAKYAQAEKNGGISLSYTPWLRNLVNDISLLYLAGYYKLDDRQVLSGSLLYFTLGEIIFRDATGVQQNQHTPSEFSLDAAYTRLFTDNISGGITFKFIRTDLTGGYSNDGTGTKAGVSFATDLSTYYQDDLTIEGYDSELGIGLVVSNIGNKISYSENNQDEDFLPTNLRLGTRLTTELDKYNKISLAVDFNKLLVPTPNYDSTVSVENIGLTKGIFTSFGDAPGGYREELKEISVSTGLEYWYQDQFAVRTGYFHESTTKGNRKFFTLGVGLKLNVLGFDFAYLIPNGLQSSPLANTIRFTISFDFDKSNNSSTNTGG